MGAIALQLVPPTSTTSMLLNLPWQPFNLKQYVTMAPMIWVVVFMTRLAMTPWQWFRMLLPLVVLALTMMSTHAMPHVEHCNAVNVIFNTYFFNYLIWYSKQRLINFTLLID
jgi:hypothetical protein